MLELRIPIKRIKFGEPTAKSGKLLDGESFNLTLNSLNFSHDSLLNS